LQISIIGNLPALQQPITSLLLEKSVNLMCLLHSRDILKKNAKIRTANPERIIVIQGQVIINLHILIIQ